MLSELGSIDALKKRLTARLSELDAKEEQYLDLVGEPGWPKAKLQKKLAAIASERAEIEGQLADTTTKLATGRQFFLTALELLSDPQEFYRRGDATVKHSLTKVIFAKLYLDMQDVTLVSGHELGEGLGDLIEAEERTWTFYRRSARFRAGKAPGTHSRAGMTAGPSMPKGLLWTILRERTYSPGLWWTRVRVGVVWWSYWPLTRTRHSS